MNELTSDGGLIVLRDESVDFGTLLGSFNDVEEKYLPKTVFTQGDTTLLQRSPRVSIIGTRQPTETGKQHTEKITKFLVKHEAVIISGLAAGIDTIAHTTAIKSGGKTIAVLGTPLKEYYPKENKELQEEIARDHLLLSQFAAGTPIQKQNFPARNRTMALISHASVIVEAGKTSGTQHQGWEALRLGRPLFIMEELAQDTTLIWPQKMLEYGAQILSIKDLPSMLESLPSQMVVSYDFTS